MDRKKRWIVKNSQLNNQTEKFKISWSSSEEEMVTFKSGKKLKSDNSCGKQFCEEFLNEEESLFNNCTPYNIENSPVLYGKQRLSPVIAYQNDLSRSLSPVIGKKSKLREIKRKIHDSKDTTKHSEVTRDFQCLSTKWGPLEKLWHCTSQTQNSPDLFGSQDRFVIEVENTQVTPQSIQINDTSTEEIDTIQIEEISQIRTSDSVDISSNSGSTNSSINTEPVLFYYKVQMKKRYKKGGFASKLQKALQNQRMSVAIWNHEVYLSKEHGWELEEDRIELKVLRKFQEFDCDFLECCIIRKDDENICDTSNRMKTCVVLLNRNVHYAIGENNLLLYKPFSIKTILYHGELIDCYYNVCKIY